MKSREARRQVIVEGLADHLLKAGLPGASLRPLAKAAGTSDRMLLYYFADKNELLSATLGLVAVRLMALMEGALPGKQPYAILLPRVCEFLDSAPYKPYMRLWFEVLAAASRKTAPFHAIAGQLCDGFLQWTADRLKVDREEDRLPTAALLFATVEGLVLLNTVGRHATVTAALKGASLAKSRQRSH